MVLLLSFFIVAYTATAPQHPDLPVGAAHGHQKAWCKVALNYRRANANGQCLIPTTRIALARPRRSSMPYCPMTLWSGAAVLVLANKQDQANAASAAEPGAV